MSIRISGAAYALPSRALRNDEIAELSPRWTAESILEKTGIATRYLASDGECASDFATAAAERLFEENVARPEEIEFLFFVTQAPDYFLPTTACVIQDRLGLPCSIGAFDMNLGCSGFVYALAVAQGWISTGLGKKGLILTGDTYTRFTKPEDVSTRAIFGDGGAAVLVETSQSTGGLRGFVFGTDGSGAERLIVRNGGMRNPVQLGEEASAPRLFMDGASIFTFTLDSVPKAVAECLSRSECALEDIDLFLFHQANSFMIEHLRDKIGIPEERFPVHMQNCGNTVSSTIPILIAELAAEGCLKPHMTLMLVGFGVGFSWAACTLNLGDAVPTGVSGAK